ncbi:hypothetical protein [Kitasatospora sp. HPMI-4]|uniref:hypothetical protein n=1 Tax=Kitasatospora sp. HPMI-4 TaxID=3448443 RepID=UPI003F1A44A3
MRPYFHSRAMPPRDVRPPARITRPRTREGTALLGVLTLLLVEMVALGLAPGRARPLIGACLFGAGATVFVLVAVVRWSHRAMARRGRSTAPLPSPDGQWYDAKALEGYPKEEIARLLPLSADPGRNRLQTAWVLAAHGRDAAWIARHLDLPADLARLLADTAAHRAAADRT